MKTKTTADDLALAAEWLDEYDPEDALISERMRRVAEWLRGQATARRREAAVRTGMRVTGATRKQVVSALGRIAARQCQ
jgi:hypothetical protein